VDLLLLAWRYLVARPITLVATLSVTVGLMAIVIVDSVMSGFLGEQRALIRALAPDVTIAVDGFDEPAARALLDRVRAADGVRSASPRVEVAAMHRAKGVVALVGAPRIGDSYFVNLIGLDAEELTGPLRHVLEATPTRGERPEISHFLERSLVPRADEPFWFDPEDPFWAQRLPVERRFDDELEPILFGRPLAYRFGYEPGTVVTIATMAGKPEPGVTLKPRTRDFVVVGTFATRDTNFDVTHAVVPRARLVDFAALDAPIQELALSVDGEPAAMRDRLATLLADARLAPGAIETWEDRRRLLLGAVESERRVMNVAMFFVVIVATFSLFVTLHQMVRRKTRDIGVLAALGSSRPRAGLLFLVCGLIVTLAGSLVGLAAGMGLAHWLNPLLDLIERFTGWRLFAGHMFRFDELPVQVDLSRLLGYAAVSIGCGTLFTLLPAWRAARLDPVEALRHE